MSCTLGYGHASFNILKSLSKLGIQISLFPIGGNIQLTTNDHQLVQTWVNNQDTFNPNSPSLTIWHENNLAERIGQGSNYALSFFELDTLSQRRRTHLNSVNHIIAPSGWAKSVMENNGVTVPITTIPMGVDTDIFKPNLTQKTDDTFRILVIGKFETRKGHDLLPEIFNKTFYHDDNFELWMMCDNPFLTPEETQEWENYYTQTLEDRVKFIHQVKTDQELASIINKADCGISLSRAEGFNLPLLQMMACGKDIIATNYSAHTQFCNHDNSYLVHITETEEAYDGKWFGSGTGNEGRWAKIGQKEKDIAIGQLKRRLTSFNRHKQTTNNINTEGLKTAQNLTWDICATKIKNLIFGND